MIAVEAADILEEQIEDEEMPNYNQSLVCSDIIEQIYDNKTFKAYPELTLDIENGLTPDVCVYLREKTRPIDVNEPPRFAEMPLVVVEVVSPSQNSQALLKKAVVYVDKGVEAVWTVEPILNVVVVTTKNGIQRFYNTEVESEGIKVDFRRIFGEG